MLSYRDVQAILDEAVEGQDILAHGAFWRSASRDEFVAKRVFNCPIIFVDASGRMVGASSPLVRILRGPIECPIGRARPQMPRGFGPLPAEQVQAISDWIDAQCPV